MRNDGECYDLKYTFKGRYIEKKIKRNTETKKEKETDMDLGGKKESTKKEENGHTRRHRRRQRHSY